MSTYGWCGQRYALLGLVTLLTLLRSMTAQAQEPTVPASDVIFTSVTESGMNIAWTAGDGANHLVVVKQGAPVDSNPVDGTTYTNNATFANGTQIGTGNYVVYKSTGTNVTISGLLGSTTYHVAVYEFNGSAGTEDYLTTTPATGSQTTAQVVAPTVDASSVAFTSVSSNSMMIRWTPGNGTNRIVVVKAGSAPTGTPTDGVAYTANRGYGLGSPLGDGYVVYNGSGNSVTLTNLDLRTVYYVRIFEYNGFGTSILYYTAGTPGSGSSAVDIFWALTTSGDNGNWSAGSSWIGGTVPTGLESASVSSANGGFTNNVDVSTNVLNLIFDRANGDEVTITTAIAAGQTLSVLGPDGLLMQHFPHAKFNSAFDFSGETLLVSNSTSRFILNSGQNANNSSRSQTMNFSGLNNCIADVDFWVAANGAFAPEGADAGDQTAKITLAKTNLFTAHHVDDYTALDFTNSFEIARHIHGSVNNTFAQNSLFKLGTFTAFYGESFGLGRGSAAGNLKNSSSPSTSWFGTLYANNPNGFSVQFANASSSALFRNTDGISPMSLVAVGVASGDYPTYVRNDGLLDLRGGFVDMLVDAIWLGRNRPNAVSTENHCGGFAFDNGSVTAGDIIVGYMKYTNAAVCLGTLWVGGTGVLTVANSVVLGYTPDNDPNGDFISAENSAGGLFQIGSGGTALINRIDVGAASENNQITLNSGSLVVSNTIATETNWLNNLRGQGGSLTLFVNGSAPLVYVSNLTATAVTYINVGGYTNLGDFPETVPVTTIPIIQYDTAVSANNWAGGTSPGGLSVAIFDDPDTKTIKATLSVGTPKTLVWKDYTGDHTWNTTSANWLDVSTGLETNFASLDVVMFDDSGYPDVNIPGTIYPAQTAGGTVISNYSAAYTFGGSGALVGAAPMIKKGTGSAFINVPSQLAPNVVEGILTNGYSGVLGNVTVGTNGTFVNNNTLLGGLSSSGVVLNNGTLPISTAVRNGGMLVNYGDVNGPVSVSGTNSSFVNNSAMTASSFTISSGATLENNSTINATSGMTVNSGGTLIDNVDGAISGDPGSINVGSSQLTVASGGTFIPGGNNIKMTKFTEYPQYSARPAGGVNLNAGAVVVLKVNTANALPNTTVLANQFQFGPSPGSTGLPRAFNGCTLVITNVGGTPFAAGQVFNFFQYYNGGDIWALASTSTNSFPVIQPAIPGTGLKWSLDELYFKGNIKVIGENDPAYAITLASSVTTVGGTNYFNIAWPESNQGGWLQFCVTGLTNGLGPSNNWTYVQGSSTNTQALVPAQTSQGAVFYRFIYP